MSIMSIVTLNSKLANTIRFGNDYLVASAHSAKPSRGPRGLRRKSTAQCSEDSSVWDGPSPVELLSVPPCILFRLREAEARRSGVQKPW